MPSNPDEYDTTAEKGVWPDDILKEHSHHAVGAFQELVVKCGREALVGHLLLLATETRTLDSWESATNGFTQQQLKQMADEASRLERDMLDFSNRAKELFVDAGKLRKSRFVMNLFRTGNGGKLAGLHPIWERMKGPNGIKPLKDYFGNLGSTLGFVAESAKAIGPLRHPQRIESLDALMIFVEKRCGTPMHSQLGFVLEALDVNVQLVQYKQDRKHRKVNKTTPKKHSDPS